MNLEQFQAQRRYMEKNLDSFLKDYEGGFIVIERESHKYYKTNEEVNKAYPVFMESPKYGNRPLLVDIAEEQWKAKNSSRKGKESDLELTALPDSFWNWEEGWDVPYHPENS